MDAMLISSYCDTIAYLDSASKSYALKHGRVMGFRGAALYADLARQYADCARKLRQKLALEVMRQRTTAEFIGKDAR